MIFSNRTFDILKWVCIIALPSLATLYGVVANIWGIPYGTEIPATITAVAAFIGALLGVSTIQYKKKENDHA